VQRFGIDGVEAPGSFRAYRGETVLAQHLQVEGNRGLAYPELLADPFGEFPRGPLAVDEQLQQTTPDRVTEDVERVHTAIIQFNLK